MFWVVDFRKDAKGSYHPVVIGGRAFTVRSQAQNYMDKANLSSRAEIFETSTSNQMRATQEIKAELIKKYRSLDQGMARAYHK